MGLTYNAKGGSIADAATETKSAPKSEEKEAAPKKVAAAKPKKAAGGGMAAVMGDLSKGLNVTKGMKRVTKDMKTKNRKDRSGKVVVPKKKKFGKKKRKKFGPPATRLQGGRWMVENYEEEAGIVQLEKCDLKSNVFITMCDDCTIQISKKVKAVTIDSC